MGYMVKNEDSQKVITLTLTAEQLEAISGAMDIVGIELAEQKDPYLPIHYSAHKAIIDVLESNFDDDDYVNPDFDEDDEYEKSKGKTHKLRTYLHGENSKHTSVHYFWSKREADDYCDTSGLESTGAYRIMEL